MQYLRDHMSVATGKSDVANIACISWTAPPVDGGLERELSAIWRALPEVAPDVRMSVLTGSRFGWPERESTNRVDIRRVPELCIGGHEDFDLSQPLEQRRIDRYVDLYLKHFGEWPHIVDVRNMHEGDPHAAAAAVEYANHIRIPCLHSSYYFSIENRRVMELDWSAHLVRNSRDLQTPLMQTVSSNRILETSPAVDLEYWNPHTMRSLGRPVKASNWEARHLEVFLASTLDEIEYPDMALGVAVALADKNLRVRLHFLDSSELAVPERWRNHELHLERLAHAAGIPIVRHWSNSAYSLGSAFAQADLVLPEDPTDNCVTLAMASGTPWVDCGVRGTRRSITAITDDIVAMADPATREDRLFENFSSASLFDSRDAVLGLLDSYHQAGARPISSFRHGRARVPFLLERMISGPTKFRRELAVELESRTASADDESERNVELAIPMRGPDTRIEDPLRIARTLGLATTVYCSDATEVRMLASATSDSDHVEELRFVDISAFRSHALAMPKTASHPYAMHESDVAAKRTLAVLSAKMRGIDTLLFVDDDITHVSISDLESALRAVGPNEDQFDVVVVPVTEQIDKSTVFEVAVRKGMRSDVYSGYGIAALRVEAAMELLFLPMINEDWMNSCGAALRGRLGFIGQGGQVKTWRIASSQDRSTTHRSTMHRSTMHRAVGEEVGDVIGDLVSAPNDSYKAESDFVGSARAGSDHQVTRNARGQQGTRRLVFCEISALALDEGAAVASGRRVDERRYR